MKKNLNRIWCVLFLLSIIPLTAAHGWAQSSTSLDLSTGYSYVRLNSAGGHAADLHGWGEGAQFSLSKSLGVEAEVGGQYGNQSGANLSLYTFLAGPRIVHRTRRMSLFGHVLLGGARLNASAAGLSDSHSGFATMLGGGFEAKLSPRVTARVLQADYLLSCIASRNQNSLRLGAGLVFHIGARQ